MELPKLHIPLFPLQTGSRPNGDLELWDAWRKKMVKATPEEWVRQQLLHWLVQEFHYPAGRIMVESSVQGLPRNRRLDALVLDSQGNPYLIIEVKAPEVEISNRTFLQLSDYNSQVKAPYMMVSNGIKTYAVEILTGGYRHCQSLPKPPP